MTLFRRFSPALVATTLFTSLLAVFCSRAALQLESLTLRHQLGGLRRSVRRPKLIGTDRFSAVLDVEVRHGQPGRPPVSQEIRQLIRKMCRENPLWGAPRFHGDLLKLGTDIGETSVSKYLIRPDKPPSRSWRTFLDKHVRTMVSVDFFTVPSVQFQALYVFLALAHERRRVLHFGVTAHPTAEWTVQQLREAFPWETARAICCAIATGSSGRSS